MTNSIEQKAAAQFGSGVTRIETLGEGLIHRTWKVEYLETGGEVVLQCINQRTFPQPENIIQNYIFLYDYLLASPGTINIPALRPTQHRKFFWIDEEDNFWRATQFIPDSCSLSIAGNESHPYAAAHCFARFTRSLAGIDTSRFNVIIPGFHNLEYRYTQFEEAIAGATSMRLLRSTHLISELRQRKKLVSFYLQLSDESSYPTRVMHHDAKISNILFNKQTGDVICPVDLDTVMPGKFFSDMGDMIRSMASAVDENSTEWESISINRDYYQAILEGYREGIGDILTAKEKDDIHYSGLIMIYMQSLRFLSDFLNNDIYYKTTYPEQNLNRALNQLLLLEQLEELLKEKYAFHPYL